MKQKLPNNNQNFSNPHLPPIQSPISNINNSQTNNYVHTHLPRLKNVAIQTSGNHNQTHLNTNPQLNRNQIIIGTSSIVDNNQNRNNDSFTNNNPISSRNPRRNINRQVSNENHQHNTINSENRQSLLIREPERNQNNHTPHRHNSNNHNLDQSNRHSNFEGNALINVTDDPWDDYIIKENDVNENKNCTICISDFEIDEKVIKLKCGHIFHKSCIIPWYDNNIESPTCPICRKNLSNLVSTGRNQNQNPNNLEFEENQQIDDISHQIDDAHHIIEDLNHRCDNISHQIDNIINLLNELYQHES